MIVWLRRLFGSSAPAFTEASARDAAAIAALHAQSFHRGWSEDEVDALIADRSVVTHRVTRAGQLTGFIMARRAADEAEILSVAIVRKERGRGLSRDLLMLNLRRLAALGTATVFLEVDETNTPAIRLYTRAGFTEVARRENYYPTAGGKTAAALVLRRDLA